MNMNRRVLLVGLGALICAPAIVRASSLMPVKAWNPLVVNVKDFMMIGDVDDTAAFARAIAALPKGGTVYVPAGDYRAPGLLELTGGPNLVIQGAGRETNFQSQ